MLGVVRRSMEHWWSMDFLLFGTWGRDHHENLMFAPSDVLLVIDYSLPFFTTSSSDCRNSPGSNLSGGRSSRASTGADANYSCTSHLALKLKASGPLNRGWTRIFWKLKPFFPWMLHCPKVCGGRRLGWDWFSSRCPEVPNSWRMKLPMLRSGVGCKWRCSSRAWSWYGPGACSAVLHHFSCWLFFEFFLVFGPKLG